MRIQAERASTALKWGLQLKTGQDVMTAPLVTLTIEAVAKHSPFARFHLQPGWLVTSVQGKPIHEMNTTQLYETVRSALRLTLDVDTPASSDAPSLTPMGSALATRRVEAIRDGPTTAWGLALELHGRTKGDGSSDGRLRGVVISSIAEDGPFGGQALQPGTRVLQVQGTPVTLISSDGVQSMMRHLCHLTLDVEEAAAAPAPEPATVAMHQGQQPGYVPPGLQPQPAQRAYPPLQGTAYPPQSAYPPLQGTAYYPPQPAYPPPRGAYPPQGTAYPPQPAYGSPAQPADPAQGSPGAYPPSRAGAMAGFYPRSVAAAASTEGVANQAPPSYDEAVMSHASAPVKH